jgi:hypothetical protein
MPQSFFSPEKCFSELNFGHLALFFRKKFDFFEKNKNLSKNNFTSDFGVILKKSDNFEAKPQEMT